MAEERLSSVTKRIKDESDERKFQFSLFCDHCGMRYRTEPIFFSVRDAPTSFDEFSKVQKMIWEAEHEDAYERANQHALLAFTRCKVCGNAVCEDCIMDYQHRTCIDCGRKEEGEAGEL